MEDRNYILVAKKEYTTVLVYTLYPAIYQGLKCIWDDSKKHARPREVYAEFQNRLTRVKKWNQDVIESEYKRIVDKSKCEFLDELIKRVFVINTQILAAVNMHHADPNKKIRVQVPKGDKFIHCCYKECARAFYENALLMEDRSGTISMVDQSKNLQKAYKLIMTCIENTIRSLLPIESLLKDNMDDVEGEDATPPAILFQDYSSFANQYRQQDRPSSIPPPPPPSVTQPLSSYPTLTSVLQQQHANSNENPPSNGSLQPSVNELGNIQLPPIPEMPLNTANNNNKFDPDSLFAPSENVADEIRPLSDEEQDRDKFYEDNHKTDEEHTKTIYLGRSPSYRSNRYPDQNYNRHHKRSDDSYHKRSNDKKSDIDSEDSSNMPINAKVDDILGSTNDEDVPIVKDRNKHLDLDVFSTTNEIPLEETKDKDSKEIMDDHVKKPPALEGVDSSQNFFSDVE